MSSPPRPPGPPRPSGQQSQDEPGPEAGPPAESGLVCTGLSKSFAGVQALSDVSLEVPAASVVGLIGPNGSGKTTLLNCVSGILTPDSGSVTVRGEHVTGKPAYVCAAKGIARTFQNLRLFTSLSVEDNLLIGGHLNGNLRHPLLRVRHRRELAAELMDLLELSSLAGAVAGGLAYGIQRRVEIAR